MTKTTNEELHALGNMLTATDEWDAGRLRAIAKRVCEFADRATNTVLDGAANRLETIRETNPEIALDNDIARIRHTLGENA